MVECLQPLLVDPGILRRVQSAKQVSVWLEELLDAGRLDLSVVNCKRANWTDPSSAGVIACATDP
jgi:hypothetical protein